MSDDFVSLRMLLVGAGRQDQGLWREAVALASVPIEFESHDAVSAGPALVKGVVDICVVDAALSEAARASAINAARAANPVPLIFVSAQRGYRRPEGIDGLLIKPSDVEEARKLVEICVRTKFPTRVLVIDDSRTMRSIVRKILSASRFTLDVHEAEEANAALDQLRSGNFGMVFLDYNMPGVDGFETLSKIRCESPNVAVVMMTSTLAEGAAEKARALGALDFLKKPFYPADIDAMLERYYGLNAPLN